MKTSVFTAYSLLLACFLFCLTSCEKENPSSPAKLNIVLYNKPLDTIQHYIAGGWKLEFEKGGICSNCINDFSKKNFWWIFVLGKVRQTYNGTLVTDTTITWRRDLGINTGKDSTFIMNFYDRQGVPYSYVVDGIFNDSLQLHDNGSDPVYYHFSKVIPGYL